MERIPAFTPKQKEEVSSAPLEKIEGSLEGLVEDIERVQSFNFALRYVLSGRITSREQLRLLVNPKFDEIGRLVDFRDSTIFLPSGAGTSKSIVTRAELGENGLDAEDIPVLVDIISERQEATQEKEIAEGVLQSFDFALGRVLSGGITSEAQLRSLVSPKFDSSSGRLIDSLRNSIFLPAFAGGPPLYVNKIDLGSRGLDEIDIPVLVDIISEQRKAVQEKESAEGAITAFNFALQRVLSGGITNEAELRSLVNPKFDSSGLLIDSARNAVFLAASAKGVGRYINKSEIGSKGLDGAGLSLLGQFLNIVKNPDFPDEVKENFKAYARTGDTEPLARLRTVLSGKNDERLTTEINSIIDDWVKRSRTLDVVKDIYTGIVVDRPLEELGERLSRFESNDQDDLELTANLQNAIAAKRRRDLVERTTFLLQAPGRDVNQALATANALVSSARTSDREVGVELVKSAYQVELANFRATVQGMITKEVDPEMLRIFIDGLPLRPAIEDFDYIKAVVQIREQAFKSVQKILEINKLEEANRIRQGFARLSVDDVLADIDSFPGETEKDRATKVQLLELYRSYVAANRPEVFDDEFAEDIKARERAQLKSQFISPELGKNRDAFDFMRRRYIETMHPLMESLRADQTTASRADSILAPKGKDKKGEKKTSRSRQLFVQRMGPLERQRELTETERRYLQSVEMLSVFNPYLVACALADPGVTTEFLRHHFETLSRKTTENLKDGDYVPLIQVGLGPQGLAALGETVRNNPALASAMLVVDAGKRPGGPFAVPEGAAWELNSANKRGVEGRVLPGAPDESEELKTVRAYGSPLRWYPGERAGDATIRQGSINVTVDYLHTPDDLSNARYPTNEELDRVMNEQAALLTNKLALETRLIRLEPNTDPDTPGDKVATLRISGPDTKIARDVRVHTDALFMPTGLGESGYGFNLFGSRAARLLRSTAGASGFPKLSKTLEAFNALTGRTKEQVSPGETLVIYGKGNSTDTLVELIGGIFQTDNPRVRDITKIYVIASGDLSARPRYSLINDLKPRNGRGNLIEFVNARVGDVDFDPEDNLTRDPSQKKIVFFDADGDIIRNAAGKPIKGDAGIAATGFRSQLDDILTEYENELFETSDADRSAFFDVALRKPLTLPTNPDIALAETLANDPSVLILGTASQSSFDLDKLAQLPVEAREALLRNGAENAVAIGFRAPDTQAAVNIWLNSRTINVEATPATPTRRTIVVGTGESLVPGKTFWVSREVVPEDIVIPNNIDNELRLLSPLLSYTIGTEIEMEEVGGKRFNGELSFSLIYDPEQQKLGLTFDAENKIPTSTEVMEAVRTACMDKDFQTYALVALKKKRRNPKLNLIVSFKDGFIDPKTTFVQS